MYSKILPLILLFISTSIFAQSNAFQQEYSKGKEALKIGNHSQAIKHFEAAASLAPKNPESYLKIIECSIVRQDMNNYEKALQKLESINFEIDINIYLAYANICKNVKQYDKALTKLKEVEASYPQDIQGLVLSSYIYKKTHKGTLAIQQLEKAQKIDGKNIQVLNNLAELYSKNNPKKAISLYHQVLTVERNNTLAISALGMLYLQEFQKNTTDPDPLKKAKNYFSQYALQHPNDSRVNKILTEIEVLLQS